MSGEHKPGGDIPVLNELRRGRSGRSGSELGSRSSLSTDGWQCDLAALVPHIVHPIGKMLSDTFRLCDLQLSHTGVGHQNNRNILRVPTSISKAVGTP